MSFNSYFVLIIFIFSINSNADVLFGKVDTFEGAKFAFYEKVGDYFIMDGDIITL